MILSALCIDFATCRLLPGLCHSFLPLVTLSHCHISLCLCSTSVTYLPFFHGDLTHLESSPLGGALAAAFCANAPSQGPHSVVTPLPQSPPVRSPSSPRAKLTRWHGTFLPPRLQSGCHLQAQGLWPFLSYTHFSPRTEHPDPSSYQIIQISMSTSPTPRC